MKSKAHVWFSCGGACSGTGGRRASGPVQPQRAVDPVDALVVPPVARVAQAGEELPEAPATVPLDECGQGLDHRGITRKAIPGRLVPGRPRQPHHLARAHHREMVFRDQQRDRLPLRGRRHNFRLNRSLIAVFSRARSAYIRLSFAFSASSSRSRRNSGTVAPPYFAFHLKYVLRLIPCFRANSATWTPASPSFRTAKI